MKVDWSPRATGDLRRQCVHIARDRPQAALAVAERIVSAVERLAEFPDSAAISTGQGTRGLPVPRTGLTIVYRVKNEVLSIVTIRHQMRAPLKR